jgi:hypothetical protein
MHKVDNMVLPLPYCQLLKIVNLAWVFTMPFVLAQEMKEFLPIIMLLASIAFFGLDQVRRTDHASRSLRTVPSARRVSCVICRTPSVPSALCVTRLRVRAALAQVGAELIPPHPIPSHPIPSHPIPSQVGAELEGPYGVDDNDFPLLHMGIALVDDLDIMLRNVVRGLVELRAPATSSDPSRPKLPAGASGFRHGSMFLPVAPAAAGTEA